MREVYVLRGGYGPALTPYGCTYVRLLLPLSHPGATDRVLLHHGTELPAVAPDVVIIERSWKEGTTLADAERALATLTRRGIPFLHALDDDLLALSEDLPRPDETARVVALLAREARGVLVATMPLADRMRRLNPNVVVVPNALDERLFAPRRRERGSPPTIGYMGTRTHVRDLGRVVRGVRELLVRRTGRVRLEIVGVGDRRTLEPLLSGLPVAFSEPGPEDVYPRFVRWMLRTLRWDVAIAPLEETPFARAKSDLKYLDYALLGAAGVYADATPYRDSVVDGTTGLLRPLTPEAFRLALEELLDDEGLGERIAAEAEARVRATRTLATRAREWPDAIETLLGR